MTPEAGSTSTIVIQQQNSVPIQDLPFTIQLKEFVIEYYLTGMPKLFASEVIIRCTAIKILDSHWPVEFGGELDMENNRFLLKYFLSSQSAIL